MRIGGYTLTLRRGDRVIKIPKMTDTAVYSSTYQPVALEFEIYERLGNHEGIAEIFERSDGAMEMPYYKNGNLEDYFNLNPEPSHQKASDWIRGLVDTRLHPRESRPLL